MRGNDSLRTLTFLPLVKAYPALSRRYGEVSCVAGLDMDSGDWIRLYPVPFRALLDRQKFRKYEAIRARVQRPRGDLRPESWRVDAESIEIVAAQLPSDRGWEARRALVQPAIAGSMCSIRAAQKRDRTSLRMFRPAEIIDFDIESVEPDPEKGQRAADWAAQPSLGATDLQLQRKALEQIHSDFATAIAAPAAIVRPTTNRLWIGR
jgi:hypothetical protein